MRLGGRLAAAIEVLEDIDRRHRPAADALKDWGLSHRFAGAGDRAAIGNIVYDALRRKLSAGWIVGADTPRGVGFGALLLERRETPQSLNAALVGEASLPRHHSPRRNWPRLQPATWRMHRIPCVPTVRHSARPHLQDTFGGDWVEEGIGLAARPPLDLRVNTLLSTRERVIAELDGTGVAPTVLASAGLRIAPIDGGGRHPNVQASSCLPERLVRGPGRGIAGRRRTGRRPAWPAGA